MTMMIIRYFLLYSAFLAYAGTIHAQDQQTEGARLPPAATVEILGAEFGRFEAGDAPDESVFIPAAVVPHRTGQRYGWVIELRAAPRSVSVREEYLLPPSAASAELAQSAEDGKAADGSRTLAWPRRSQVSQRQLVPVDGRIYGEWAVGPGEPAGHRRLEVVVEDIPAAHFEFDVK